MHDVYTGTLGTFFNREEVTFKLNEVLSHTTGSLSYEVVEDKARVVILTGANEIEQEVPIFQHPLIFDTVRGEKAVACDLRPFMKAKLDDMISVREKLDDKYNGMMQLYRLILTKLLVDGERYWLGILKDYMMESFSAIMRTNVSILTFDETAKRPVDLISKLHFVSLDIDGKIDDKTKILELLPRTDVVDILKGNYTYIYNKILDGSIVLPSRTIGSLTNNIKAAIDKKRANGLTVDVIIKSLSTGFFSLDRQGMAIAMVEDKPTLATIMYMVLNESINSKSTFRKIIHGARRYTKPNEFVKSFTKIVNDQFVG